LLFGDVPSLDDLQSGPFTPGGDRCGPLRPVLVNDAEEAVRVYLPGSLQSCRAKAESWWDRITEESLNHDSSAEVLPFGRDSGFVLSNGSKLDLMTVQVDPLDAP
jgi:hypothetical protein